MVFVFVKWDPYLCQVDLANLLPGTAETMYVQSLWKLSRGIQMDASLLTLPKYQRLIKTARLNLHFNKETLLIKT